MSNLFPEVKDYIIQNHPELARTLGYHENTPKNSKQTIMRAKTLEEFNQRGEGGAIGEPPLNEKAMMALQTHAPMVAGVVENLGKVAGAVESAVGDPLSNVGMPGANMAMTAFHGSPFEFEKFMEEAIGTGEGSAAYGHGLYFAENPETGKMYQKTAAQVGGIAKLEKKTPGKLYTVDIPDEHIEKMLDWDKDLSEQPKTVRDALVKSGLATETNDFGTIEGSKTNPSGRDIYAHLVEMAREGYGPEKLINIGTDKPKEAASKFLNSLGVSGIKYFDQWSRIGEDVTSKRLYSMLQNHDGDVEKALNDFMGSIYDTPKAKEASRAYFAQELKKMKEPTRNFVVFDPEIVKILKKE